MSSDSLKCARTSNLCGIEASMSNYSGTISNPKKIAIMNWKLQFGHLWLIIYKAEVYRNNSIQRNARVFTNIQQMSFVSKLIITNFNQTILENFWMNGL